jgi:hypothetical protein
LPLNPDSSPRQSKRAQNGEDERVKIDAPFEDALRALLRTPPAAENGDSGEKPERPSSDAA